MHEDNRVDTVRFRSRPKGLCERRGARAERH